MATKVNNVAYSWSMVEFTAPALGESSFLDGVSALKYNKVRKIETNYGKGGKAVSRGYGNLVNTASIKLDYATQQQIRGLRGSLMAVGEFDLVISFANRVAEGQLESGDWDDKFRTETVTLKGCIFNEDGMETEQDDTNIEKEFQLNPFDIIISGANAD